MKELQKLQTEMQQTGCKTTPNNGKKTPDPGNWITTCKYCNEPIRNYYKIRTVCFYCRQIRKHTGSEF